MNPQFLRLLTIAIDSSNANEREVARLIIQRKFRDELYRLSFPQLDQYDALRAQRETISTKQAKTKSARDLGLRVNRKPGA